MRRRPPLLVLALLAACAGAGRAAPMESGRPQMRFFGTPELHSKGPVRAFAETADGSLFVGSNYLVVFDGVHLERIEVPGAYSFQALASAPADAPGARRRLWVGAIGAFGYVDADRLGRWNFVSLAPQARAAGLEPPAQVDAVLSLGGGAAFVAGERVLRWDGTQLTAWAMPAPGHLRIAPAGADRIWIYREGAGLFELGTSGDPRLVRDAGTLPPGPVQWLAAAPGGPAAPGGTGLLVGTAEGVYRLTGGNERAPEGALRGPAGPGRRGGGSRRHGPGGGHDRPGRRRPRQLAG